MATLLASTAVRSLVLLLLTLGVAILCRRRSAAVVHGIWTVGIAGCLVLPVVSWFTPTWSLPVLPSQVSDAPIAAPASSTSLASRASRTTFSGQPPLLPTENREPQESIQPRAALQSAPKVAAKRFELPSWITLALIAWAAGVVTVAVRLLQQIRLTVRLIHQAEELTEPSWLELRDAAVRQLGLPRSINLKTHAGADSPMVAGLLRPVVLLPAGANGWSHERRKLVLLHELAHIGRKDVLTQMVAAIACALYWFNPLTWWGASQMKRLREIACDDAVVTHTNVPADYAQTLLEVAREYRSRQLISAVAMARSNRVEDRITAILDAARNRAGLSRRSVRAFAVVALLGAVGVGTCQLSSRGESSPEHDPDVLAIGVQKAGPEAKPEGKILTVVVARHVLLLDGKTIITWKKLDDLITAADDPSHVYCQFYITRGVHEANKYGEVKQRIWDLSNKFGLHSHSEGSLAPRSDFRYDQIKTAADMAQSGRRRVRGVVVDEKKQPVAGAEVLLVEEVDESLPYKEHDIALVRGRVRTPCDHIVAITDEQGRFEHAIDPQRPAYFIAIHPDHGFTLISVNSHKEGDSIHLLRWGQIVAELESPDEAEQTVSLSTRHEAEGMPPVVLNQYWSDLKHSPANGQTFAYDHVPPIFSTTVQRDHHKADGGMLSINELSVGLLPGETRRLKLGAMTPQQREFLESVHGPIDPPAAEKEEDESSHAAENEPDAEAQSNARTMKVHVLDEAGEPLEGAKVSIGVWYVEGYQGEKVPKEYFADSRGIVRLDLPKRLKILRMWPSKPGYVPLFVNFGRGMHEEGRLLPEEYAFRLQKGHRLSGRIVDADGHPIANAKVQVRVEVDEPAWGSHPEPMISTWLTDSDFNSPPPSTDSDGRWSIENAPAPPGGTAKDYEFQLLITHPDYAGDKEWSETQKLEGITTEKLRDGSATIVLGQGSSVRRVVVGTVTDAVTGENIERFQAMPVIVFRPDFCHTRTTDAKMGQKGRYELPLTGSADPTDSYRVRFEAEGYRSVVSEESFGPLDERATLNISMQPAPPREGQVVDAEGQPVASATVLQASPSEVPDISNGKADPWESRPVTTDTQGEFQLSATTEPVRVRAYHDRGFAEKAVAAEDTEIGELKLEPWAKISGRLVQKGRPVPGQSIYFRPLVRRGPTEARFQDLYHTESDSNGNFEFDPVPPISGSISASLGPWRDSPLTSSEEVPLRLEPGEHRKLTLGGEATTVTGRVVTTGRNNDEMSKQWSLNYLISRDRGLPYPDDAEPLSFDSSGSVQQEWLHQPDFQNWLATRDNHFVKLAEDGRLQIHGVAPGEYDLVIQLYEQPAGCLVETIGEKIVPMTVDADHADAVIELGAIEVECRQGPRVGSDMRAYQFTDVHGQVQSVNDMSGRYVLFHAWATWCEPCLQSMPQLASTIDEYSTQPLTAVGLNFDKEPAAATKMAEAQGWEWAQNYLGDDSELMHQLAISSVPAYYLIGPDGKLIGSANQWEEMAAMLQSALP